MIESLDIIPKPHLQAYRRSSILFGISGGLLFFLVLAAFISQQVWFQKNLTIDVVAPSAMGLDVGTPVRMSGLRIGLLHQLSLLPSGQVRLVLKVPLKYRAWLSPDSLAKIKSDSLISQSYIELVPAPADPAKIPTSFRVKFVKTANLDDLLHDAQKTQAELQALLISSHRIAEKQLPLTLHKANDVMTTGNSLAKTLEREIPRVTQPGSSMAKTIDHELPPTAQQLRSTLHSVDQTGKSLQGLLTELRPQLTGSLQELQETLARTNKFLQQVESFVEPFMGSSKEKAKP